MDRNLSEAEKEHLEKYGYLYNPNELLSEKLKRYNIITAQKDVKEKNAPYVWSIATARKSFGNSISVYKLSKEGLTLKDVQVRRHLKRVACGTDHSEREWRIIESYEKKVWAKDGHTKIIVGLKNR